MNFEQALKKLFSNWADQDPDFKTKWKSYRSKWQNGAKDIHSKKMEEMLIDAGFKKQEKWVAPK